MSSEDSEILVESFKLDTKQDLTLEPSYENYNLQNITATECQLKLPPFEKKMCRTNIHQLMGQVGRKDAPTNNANLLVCNKHYLAYLVQNRVTELQTVKIRARNTHVYTHGVFENTGSDLVSMQFLSPNDNIISLVDKAGTVYIVKIMKHAVDENALKLTTLCKLEVPNDDDYNVFRENTYNISWGPWKYRMNWENKLIPFKDDKPSFVLYGNKGCCIAYKFKVGLNQIQYTYDPEESLASLVDCIFISNMHDTCEINSCYISPDSRFLSTSGGDGKFKIWELEFGSSKTPLNIYHDLKPQTEIEPFCDEDDTITSHHWCDTRIYSSHDIISYWSFAVFVSKNNVIKLVNTSDCNVIQTISLTSQPVSNSISSENQSLIVRPISPSFGTKLILSTNCHYFLMFDITMQVSPDEASSTSTEPYAACNKWKFICPFISKVSTMPVPMDIVDFAIYPEFYINKHFVGDGSFKCTHRKLLNMFALCKKNLYSFEFYLQDTEGYVSNQVIDNDTSPKEEEPTDKKLENYYQYLVKSEEPNNELNNCSKYHHESIPIVSPNDEKTQEKSNGGNSIFADDLLTFVPSNDIVRDGQPVLELQISPIKAELLNAVSGFNEFFNAHVDTDKFNPNLSNPDLTRNVVDVILDGPDEKLKIFDEILKHGGELSERVKRKASALDEQGAKVSDYQSFDSAKQEDNPFNENSSAYSVEIEICDSVSTNNKSVEASDVTGQSTLQYVDVMLEKRFDRFEELLADSLKNFQQQILTLERKIEYQNKREESRNTQNGISIKILNKVDEIEQNIKTIKLNPNKMAQNVTDSLMFHMEKLLEDHRAKLESQIGSSLFNKMEQLCQKIFVDVDKTFKSGTRDYLKGLQVHLAAFKTPIENGKHKESDSIKQLQDSFTNLTKHFHLMDKTIKESISCSLSRFKKEMTENIMSSVRDLQNQQINAIALMLERIPTSSVVANTTTDSTDALDEFVKSARKPVITDPLAKAKNLFKHSQFVEALKLGLKNNLKDFTLKLCMEVDSSKLLKDPNVSLSMDELYQLVELCSDNLSQDQDIKLGYLQEILLMFDVAEHKYDVGFIECIQQLMTNFEQQQNCIEKSSYQLVRMLKVVCKRYLI